MLCFNRLSTGFIHTKIRETLGGSSLLPFSSGLWSVTIAELFLVNISGLQLLEADRKAGLHPHHLDIWELATVTENYPESATCINILQRAHNTQTLPVRKVWWATLCLFRPLVPNFGCTLKSPGEKKSPGDIRNTQCLGYSFPDGSVVKNSSENTGDIGDAVSIPGSGRSPVVSSTLAWEIPWTEEPGGLQSMGLQRVGHDWTSMHATRGLGTEGRKGEIQEFFLKAPSRDSHNPAVRVKNECFRFSHKHLIWKVSFPASCNNIQTFWPTNKPFLRKGWRWAGPCRAKGSGFQPRRLPWRCQVLDP